MKPGSPRRTLARWLVPCAVATVVFAATGSAWAIARTAADTLEVQKLRSIKPQAADLLERGEDLALAGKYEEADALFKEGEAIDRDGSILWRRDCEVLTVLGRRDEAIAACNEAAQTGHSNLNLRATLRALVVGPKPRPMDLFVALALTEDPRRRFARPDPVLLSADCAIAESMGDASMLQQCASGLEAVAPDDPSTHHALRLLLSRCPPWRFWLGWGTLLGLFALTARHAASRRLRRRRSAAGPVLVAGILVGLGVLAPGLAWADPADMVPKGIPAPTGALGKWRVDDDDPQSSIPSDADKNADPLDFGYWIQDCIMKAQHASKRGDHAKAAKFWIALGVAVPDRAVSFTRLCDEYEAVKDYPKAIEACGQALLRDGLTAGDYAHFVRLMLAKPGPVSDKEKAALVNVLDHMKSEDAGRDLGYELECDVGVRTSDVKMLQECTKALEAAAPGNPKTIPYKWALAMQNNDFTQAKRMIEQAKAKGIQLEVLANMQRATSDMARQYWNRLLLWAACAGLLIAAGWGGVKLMTARRRTEQPA